MTTLPFNLPDAESHADAAVAEWLHKAAGDMRTAERELLAGDKPNFDAVCFHAQQGAEKLIKAVLESKSQRPPRIHDLVHLDALVRAVAPAWSFPIGELSELSSAAVEARYPGYSATHSDAKRAFEIAVRLWSQLRPLL